MLERLRRDLQPHGYSVEVHPFGAGAVDWVRRTRPLAVVIEARTSLSEGIALCRGLRRLYDNPIILMVDRASLEDQVNSLLAGADDLLTRPLHPEVLRARIQARLRGVRHRPPGAERRIELPRILVDAERQAARTGGKRIDLTATEFEVLWLLACRAGRCVLRSEICSQIRGFGYNSLDRSIDQRIARLRKRLGDDGRSPRLIKSVRGEGTYS